jgi:hypothetical protein
LKCLDISAPRQPGLAALRLQRRGHRADRPLIHPPHELEQIDHSTADSVAALWSFYQLVVAAGKYYDTVGGVQCAT